MTAFAWYQGAAEAQLLAGAGGDITIIHDAGVLVLGAAAHSVAEQISHSPGILVLSAAAHSVAEQIAHTVGALVLSGPAHTLLEAIEASAGVLLLQGGNNVPIGGEAPEGAGHTHSIHPHRHRDGDDFL